MDEYAQIDKVCRLLTECTHCPKRKICPSLPEFYNEKRFYETLRASNLESFVDAIINGKDMEDILLSVRLIHSASTMIEKKRRKELSIHSTYSP